MVVNYLYLCELYKSYHNIFEYISMFNKQVNSLEQIEEGEISDVENLQVQHRTIPNSQLLHQKQKTKQKQKKSTVNDDSSQQSQYIIQQVKIMPSTFPPDRKKQRKDIKTQDKNFRYEKKFKNSGSPENTIYHQPTIMQPIQAPQQPVQNTNSYFPQYPNNIPNNAYQYQNQQSRYMPINIYQSQTQQIQNMPIQNVQQVQPLQSMNIGYIQNPYNQFNHRNPTSTQIQAQLPLPLTNTIPNMNTNPISTPVSPNKMINNTMINQIYGYNTSGQGNYGQFNSQNLTQMNKYGQNYQTQNPQFIQQTAMNQIPTQGHYQSQQISNIQPIQSQYIQHQQYQSSNLAMNINIGQNIYGYNQNANINYNTNSSSTPNSNSNGNIMNYSSQVNGNIGYNVGYQQRRWQHEQEEKRRNREIQHEKKIVKIEKEIKNIVLNRNIGNEELCLQKEKQREKDEVEKQKQQIIQILQIIKTILNDQALTESEKQKNRDKMIGRQKEKQREKSKNMMLEQNEKVKDKETDQQYYKQFMKLHENNIQTIFVKITSKRNNNSTNSLKNKGKIKERVYQILKLLQLQMIIQKLKEKQIQTMLLDNSKKKEVEFIFRNLYASNTNTNNNANGTNGINSITGISNSNSQENNKNKKDPRIRIST